MKLQFSGHDPFICKHFWLKKGYDFIQKGDRTFNDELAAQELIKELEKHKIIRYVKHSFKYVLFERTDLDIELAIDEAGRIVEKATNVVDHLNQYFEFPFISAKAA